MSTSLPLHKLVVDDGDGVLVVRIVSPRLLDDQIDGVRREFAGLVAQQKPQAVVLDLGGVTMISSLGVGAVIGMFKKVREHGGRFTLCSLSAIVEHVFQLCQLIESDEGKGLLQVFPDVATATAALADERRP